MNFMNGRYCFLQKNLVSHSFPVWILIRRLSWNFLRLSFLFLTPLLFPKSLDEINVLVT